MNGAHQGSVLIAGEEEILYTPVRGCEESAGGSGGVQ